MQKNFFLFFFFDLNVYYIWTRVSISGILRNWRKINSINFNSEFYVLTSESQQMSKSGVTFFHKNSIVNTNKSKNLVCSLFWNLYKNSSTNLHTTSLMLRWEFPNKFPFKVQNQAWRRYQGICNQIKSTQCSKNWGFLSSIINPLFYIV